MACEQYSGVIQTIEGQQGKIGDVVAKWYKLSILEIGGKVLQDITVSQRLVIFLRAGEEVDLYIDGKCIIALGRADGKLFLANHKNPGVMSLVFGIAMIPVSGVGLLLLFIRHINKKRYDSIQEIVSRYPSYENLLG